MKTREIVDGLRLFNKWRRGADIDQPDPKDIGIWIEMAAIRLNQLEVALDRSTAYLDMINGDIHLMNVDDILVKNRKLLKGE